VKPIVALSEWSTFPKPYPDNCKIDAPLLGSTGDNVELRKYRKLKFDESDGMSVINGKIAFDKTLPQ
jgi:hypothetical protein